WSGGELGEQIVSSKRLIVCIPPCRSSEIPPMVEGYEVAGSVRVLQREAAVVVDSRQGSVPTNCQVVGNRPHACRAPIVVELGSVEAPRDGHASAEELLFAVRVRGQHQGIAVVGENEFIGAARYVRQVPALLPGGQHACWRSAVVRRLEGDRE